MAKLYLVRHGEAASGFDGHLDPGLSPLGISQARTAAARLADLPRMELISSPLARARETAAPLEILWQTKARIESAVAEIPSPTDDLAARAAWLRSIMPGTWQEAGAPSLGWRDRAVAFLCAIKSDSVIFSHYVAINAAVGAALGDQRVICFAPDNASITIMDNTGGALRLIEKGAERDTAIR